MRDARHTTPTAATRDVPTLIYQGTGTRSSRRLASSGGRRTGRTSRCDWWMTATSCSIISTRCGPTSRHCRRPMIPRALTAAARPGSSPRRRAPARADAAIPRRRLGDRRLPSGQSRQPTSRAAASPRPTRFARQGGDAHRRALAKGRLGRHARALRRRSRRGRRDDPLQPSPAASSASSGRSAGALVQRLVCHHRPAAAARASRRHADGARPAAVAARSPMPLAATGLSASALDAACLDDSARPPARGSPRPSPSRLTARAIVVDGLRGAALYGTAGGFSERGLDVAAKTGTANQSAGGTMGVVVAAWPVEVPRSGHRARRRRRGRERRRRPGRGDRRRIRGAATHAGEPRPPRAGASRPCAESIGGTASHRSRRCRMDGYVARVLAGEAAAGSPPAALEALALAVRTFAVRNRGRHDRDGFDLCATTHCQVLRDIYPAVKAAAEATSGRVLLGGRAIATVYYAASCGGHTEKPSNVWRGSVDPAVPAHRTRPRLQWRTALDIGDSGAGPRTDAQGRGLRGRACGGCRSTTGPARVASPA